MKKIFTLILAVAVLVTAFGSLGVFAANDPIVFDFSEKVEPKIIASDAANGDNWVITFSNGVSFMGKKTLKRIAYSYERKQHALLLIRTASTATLISFRPMQTVLRQLFPTLTKSTPMFISM